MHVDCRAVLLLANLFLLYFLCARPEDPSKDPNA